MIVKDLALLCPGEAAGEDRAAGGLGTCHTTINCHEGRGGPPE